ncbi:carnosine N-methyltransferase 2-like isoform X3 [Sphaerodactylus townsendi]|uniref:carnosine N-methyltransferase 2-like isoform X3 n=1 Tax=Sphaerodactylus townsendi TaxID=933632 RepID=UPI0020275962|nr:carnosine N-methyltransferase 2-like isoform X3 [Sphaerodactylus townsendi]
MEPVAKVKRFCKAKPNQITDGCLRAGVFPKGFCPMNGSRLPLVRTAHEADARKSKSESFETDVLLNSLDDSVLLPKEICVTPSMRSLRAEEYTRAFQSFLDHSTEHQCMDQFNKTELPNIVASVGNGKSTISVLGVGSGTGEQDLKMIRIIQSQHPGAFIANEVIEPNPHHILAYKEAIKNSPDLKNVSFTWHQQTSMEYEKQAKEGNVEKKYDFIHLIQMLYRVENIANTIKFFHSCLDCYAKLLIIILSEWHGFRRAHIGWKSLAIWEAEFLLSTGEQPLDGILKDTCASPLPLV